MTFLPAFSINMNAVVGMGLDEWSHSNFLFCFILGPMPAHVCTCHTGWSMAKEKVEMITTGKEVAGGGYSLAKKKKRKPNK